LATHLLGDQLLDGGDVLGALGPRLLDLGRELLVLTGVEVLERQVLELDLDPRHAEPVGERRVDLHRLGGDPLLLLRRHVRQRPHVVEAVAQLHQDDADVARHRQQHLAEVLGLLLLLGRPRQLAELGDAVDQERDLLAEQLLELLDRRRGVLDAVVEEPRAHARHVELELGDEVGDRQRVGDVGIARAAGLAFVGLGGEVVGAADDVEIGVGIVGGDARQDLLEAHGQTDTSNRRGYPGPVADARIGGRVGGGETETESESETESEAEAETESETESQPVRRPSRTTTSDDQGTAPDQVGRVPESESCEKPSRKYRVRDRVRARAETETEATRVHPSPSPSPYADPHAPPPATTKAPHPRVRSDRFGWGPQRMLGEGLFERPSRNTIPPRFDPRSSR
jgi:hypothetical protein